MCKKQVMVPKFQSLIQSRFKTLLVTFTYRVREIDCMYRYFRDLPIDKLYHTMEAESSEISCGIEKVLDLCLSFWPGRDGRPLKPIGR